MNTYVGLPTKPDIPFSTCPFPTTWTEVTADKDYIATNTYGQWECKTNIGNRVNRAFNNDKSDYWNKQFSSASEIADCEIDCPVGYIIKPTSIYLYYRNMGNGSYIQGYNENTQEWENLQEISPVSSDQEITYTISINNYYSKFRCLATMYATWSDTARIYEFQITSGILKDARGNTSAKPTTIYAGVNNIAKKVKKIYAGVNNVAKLVYPRTSIPFTTCPFPTTWTQVTTDKYTSTNIYGAWTITSNSNNGSALRVYNAFDNTLDTRWRSRSSGSSGNCVIDCPIKIKPKNMFLSLMSDLGNIQIQGDNDGTWETIIDIPKPSSQISNTYTVTTNNYYNKFRVYSSKSSGSGSLYVYEFQITSGEIKIE